MQNRLFLDAVSLLCAASPLWDREAIWSFVHLLWWSSCNTEYCHHKRYNHIFSARRIMSIPWKMISSALMWSMAKSIIILLAENIKHKIKRCKKKSCQHKGLGYCNSQDHKDHCKQNHYFPENSGHAFFLSGDLLHNLIVVHINDSFLFFYHPFSEWISNRRSCCS